MLHNITTITIKVVHACKLDNLRETEREIKKETERERERERPFYNFLYGLDGIYSRFILNHYAARCTATENNYLKQ